jgi:hypothetical protein
VTSLDRLDSATLAYREVRELELLLRRVVRWELMAAYGRQWLNALDDLSEAIQERARKEKIADLYDGNSSELSYLSLGELLHFIFRRKWQEIFKKVFTDDRGLERELFREIVPVRNKVAHFRSMTFSDLSRLKVLSEVKSRLRSYYGHGDLVEAYLSSDPGLASEQIEEESLMLMDALSGSGHSQVWMTYGEVECLRARGFCVGIGLYCSHVFLEVRCPEEPAISMISEWSFRERFMVCFTTVDEKLLRVFWPLSLSSSEIRKSMISFQRLMALSDSSRGHLREDPSFGETLISKAHNPFIGLAF